jgi:acyl-CoA reductase-like NAD-dependent aldehyde dehydrogenase
LVDAAVASARRALPLWSARPDTERAAKLMAIATLIEQHHPELSVLVTREQGKTQSGPGANYEVGGAVAWTRVTAGLTMPEETIQDDTAASIAVHRKPAGVNQHGALHPLAPFGGVKSSGLGVEFNVDGLKEYTTIQVVNVAR